MKTILPWTRWTRLRKSSEPTMGSRKGSHRWRELHARYAGVNQKGTKRRWGSQKPARSNTIPWPTCPIASRRKFSPRPGLERNANTTWMASSRFRLSTVKLVAVPLLVRRFRLQAQPGGKVLTSKRGEGKFAPRSHTPTRQSKQASQRHLATQSSCNPTRTNQW